MEVNAVDPSQKPVSAATQRDPISLRRTDAIRTRLIIAFVAVALLPFSAISFITIISSAQGGQQQVVDQLETVLSYKEAAIVSWAASLESELSNMLSGQEMLLNMVQIVQADPGATDYAQVRESYNLVREQLLTMLPRSTNYDQIFLLNMQGLVVLSTENTLEGQDYSQRPFYEYGHLTPYVDVPTYSTALNRTIMYVSYPISDFQRRVVGVLVGRVKLTQLSDILNDAAGLGETGRTYLVDRDYRLFAGLSKQDQGRIVQTQGVLAAWGADQASEVRTDILVYPNLDGIPVTGVYRRMSDLQVVLLAEQSQAETNRSTYATLAVDASVAIASILIALFIALTVIHSISAPVAELAATANQIAAGREDIEAAPRIAAALAADLSVERDDEFSILAQAFSSMTRQLSALIIGLEQRVAERTRELEVRSNYLEASTQVSRATASILDLDHLLDQAVELIRDRFDLYYVGLFLVEEAAEAGTTDEGQPATYAVLRAGTGEAGTAMLARRHRLPVGRASMIGWCIANAQARITQQASTDAVRVANPDLPDTQSEAAIPLRSRGQTLGAISVQSTQVNAFDETSLAVLQSMADQLAVAIDNARLFHESQETLDAERRTHQMQISSAWGNWFASEQGYSLQGSEEGVKRSTEFIWRPEMQQAMKSVQTVVATPSSQQQGPEPAAASSSGSTASIPIVVRGNAIGVLHIRKPEGRSWTADEVSFLESVAEQLGVALDGARLYAETQQKAEQERLITEITSRMRASLDVNTVLETATEEIYNLLNIENLVIQLTPTAIDSGLMGASEDERGRSPFGSSVREGGGL